MLVFSPTLVGLHRSPFYKSHIELILTSHRQSSWSVIFMKCYVIRHRPHISLKWGTTLVMLS